MRAGRPPAATDPKSTWRGWARTLPPVPPDVSAAVVGHLLGSLGRVRGAVLAYLALPDEVDVAGLLAPDVITADVVLPRLGADDTMTLHRDDRQREHHRLGIAQPAASAPEVDPAQLAVVFVPGRVYDVDGYRLGRGGGHYDRLVPRLAPNVPVIGVTVSSRLVGRLPREDHDRPMTHLTTEAGVFRAGSPELRAAAESSQ